MLFIEWHLVSIKKWLYSGLVDPIEEPSIGVCLKSLSHSEDEGVVKEEDQKCWQSHKKKGNVLSMNVQDIPIMLPRSHLHLNRMFQEGKIKCSNGGMKQLCVGKEEKCCQNCNWIGTKTFCNL